jgi:ferritin-like protein
LDDETGKEDEPEMSHEGLHEPTDLVDEATKDRHRAIVSIQEEFEAVDWYDQRVSATENPELAAVLAHNRDEEKEHAAMTLEWLRRNDPVLDGHLRTYLFTTEPVTEVEAEAEGKAGGGGSPPGPTPAGPTGSGSLDIGSLKGVD